MPRIGTTGYAGTLARMANTDAAFQVPAWPALRPEVVVVPLVDGIALDHGGSPAVVRGAAVVSALRVLLPLLDGSRDAATVARDGRLSRATVNQLLGLLTVRALVQDGPVFTQNDQDVLRYVSRGVAATGAHDRADTALAQLATTSVTVIGESKRAEAVRHGLLESGLLVPVSHGPETLAIVCGVGEPDADTIADLVRRGRTVLPVQWAHGQLVCGPYLEPDATPCPNCALAGLRELAPSHRPEQERTGELDDAVALLTCEVLHTLGRFGRALGGSLVLRHDVRAWRSTSHDVVVRPDCSRCCADPLPDPPAELALIMHYEAAVALPSRRWLNPALHRAHYEPGHIAAQQRFTRAPGATMSTTDAVRLLLRQTTGLRTPVADGSAPDRYAPSPGNLGAVVSYWVTNQGAHQYDPLRDELVALPVSRTELSARVGALPDPGVVVLTADLTKLYPKYGAKSYHLAWLEAGAALANLAVSARHGGLAVRVPSRWDDEGWSAVLDADTRGELLCAVICLHDPGGEP